jgi:hypothetical protein
MDVKYTNHGDFHHFETARQEMEAYITSLPIAKQAAARKVLDLFFQLPTPEKQVIEGIYITTGTSKFEVSIEDLQKLISSYLELTDEQRDRFVTAIPFFLKRLDQPEDGVEGLQIQDRIWIAVSFVKLPLKVMEAVKMHIMHETVKGMNGVSPSSSYFKSFKNLHNPYFETLNSLFNEADDGSHEVNTNLVLSKEKTDVAFSQWKSVSALNVQEHEAVLLWIQCVSHYSQHDAARELMEQFHQTS